MTKRIVFAKARIETETSPKNHVLFVQFRMYKKPKLYKMEQPRVKDKNQVHSDFCMHVCEALFLSINVVSWCCVSVEAKKLKITASFMFLCVKVFFL